MTELLNGIYSIREENLPPGDEFVRNHPIDGEIQPLLHICEKDLDPNISHPTYIIVTSPVRWDYYYGHYTCSGCKQTWRTRKELASVWKDGHGTCEEGRA